MPDRTTYVLLEALDGDREVFGYDTFLVPWTALAEVVTRHLEDSPDDTPRELRFTLHRWTDEEHRRYCEEHDIDLGRMG